MNVLVTGGAGYVGSHVAKRLRDAGHSPVIYDNLSRGHRSVASILDVPAVYADVGDADELARTLVDFRIDCVMHFAALAEVSESVRRPLAYYQSNVARAVDLLWAMQQGGVERLVFSSTCAVYGDPLRLPISETDEKRPLSPYARGKLMVEQIIQDHAASSPAFSCMILRYVNAAGCAEDGSIGELHDPETHLVPRLVRALSSGEALTIHGTEHPTPDGTAIRDYLHVEDIADAHLLALTHINQGGVLELNLGTGRGLSVLEMIEVAEQVTGKKLDRKSGASRPGDPPVVYASGDRAKKLLGWVPTRSPENIVATAYNFIGRNPPAIPPEVQRA